MNELNLTEEELKELSSIYESKIFNKFMQFIIDRKKEKIIDDVEDLELLHKLRYSLGGNEEILDELQIKDVEYKTMVKPVEKVDPYSIL